MSSEPDMNPNDSVAIEGVRQRLESLTGSVSTMQNTLSQTHGTVLKIEAEWKFWVEQSREHDGRLFVVEKAQFDTASELRHLRDENQRISREQESVRKELKDEMDAARQEAEKREAAARARQTTVFTVIQIVAVIVFSLINIYINSTRK